MNLFEYLLERWQSDPLNLLIPAVLPLLFLILIVSIRYYRFHKTTPKLLYLLAFITIIGNCIYGNIFTFSLIESPYKITFFFSVASTICFGLIFGTLYTTFIAVKWLLSQIKH